MYVINNNELISAPQDHQKRSELISIYQTPVSITINTSIKFTEFTIAAVSGNGIIKINLLLHAFPVVTAKEKNVISIAFRHRSVHDRHNCRGTTGQWS